MVIIFLFFGYQKWFDYEAQTLIPYISQKLQMIWRKATVHKSGWPSAMILPHSSRANTFIIKSAFHPVRQLAL
jgi:uncharacterized membrane protein YkgB